MTLSALSEMFLREIQCSSRGITFKSGMSWLVSSAESSTDAWARGLGRKLTGKTEFSPSRSHFRRYCYFTVAVIFMGTDENIVFLKMPDPTHTNQ